MTEFSLQRYSELLTALKDAGYAFCMFEDTEERLAAGNPFVILRHDIDISLRAALEMARVEHEHGVRAVYFVLLRSPFYNALSRSNAEILRQLHDYGHQIALHVDLAAYEGDCAQALREIETLATFYPFANTDLATLHSPFNLDVVPVELFQQFYTVYGPSREKRMAYISDSTGRWLYGHPLDSEAFYSRKPIQLLTHPIWWIQDGETPIKKLTNCLYNDYLHSNANAKAFFPKLFRLSDS